MRAPISGMCTEALLNMKYLPVYKLADKKREARLLPRAHAQGIKQSVLSVVCRLSRRGIDNIDIRNRDWKQLT